MVYAILFNLRDSITFFSSGLVIFKGRSNSSFRKQMGGQHMYKPGVGFHYNVGNLERTLTFYTEKLGFKELYFDAGGKSAMVATNTKDCFIGFAEAQSIVPSSTCITFEVENIKQAVLGLQQKGIEFKDGIFEVPGMVKLASFFDPDGYRLMLSESESPQ
jgi:predicted enzyme related to lactoylglutathione lyase